MTNGICLAPDCEASTQVRGLCRRHYGRWYDSRSTVGYEPLPKIPRPLVLCSVEGCPKPRQAKGYCHTHYVHNRKYGTPHRRTLVCLTCGSSERHDPDLGAYCSKDCRAEALRARRAAKLAATLKHTLANIGSDPIKCGGCKSLRPALDFVGVHGKQTKRCAHCRNLAKTYRTKDETRDLGLRRAYGITADEYDSLFASQGGKCAICRLPESVIRNGLVARLAVDHCHATGAVRGLLCSACNIGLGKFRDDPERLRLAIEYLNNYIE